MTRPRHGVRRLALVALLAATCWVAGACASLRLAPHDDCWQSWGDGAATVAAGLSVRTHLVAGSDPPSIVVEVWNLEEEPASVSVTRADPGGSTIGSIRNADGRPPLVAGEALSIALPARGGPLVPLRRRARPPDDGLRTDGRAACRGTASAGGRRCRRAAGQASASEVQRQTESRIHVGHASRRQPPRSDRARRTRAYEAGGVDRPDLEAEEHGVDRET